MSFVINNLILNSEDEISDSEARTSGNRLPAILLQVDSIIKTGKIDETIEKTFAPSQIAEEIEKSKWTAENTDKEEGLFALEDHALLLGQMSIIGLENHELFDRFNKLFNCDLDKIDCALMSIGFYGQKEQVGWRYQLGSGSTRNTAAWRDLFHRSRNEGFEKTKEILIHLLTMRDTFSNEDLSKIVNDFVLKCESENNYPWRYYYVKYPVFRPRSYGKYSNSKYNINNPIDNQYLFSVMQTRLQWSENTYNPFLKAADAAHLSRDDSGQRLVYTDSYITCDNNSYKLFEKETDNLIEEIDIPHDANGTDTTDRIHLLQSICSSKAHSPESLND